MHARGVPESGRTLVTEFEATALRLPPDYEFAESAAVNVVGTVVPLRLEDGRTVRARVKSARLDAGGLVMTLETPDGGPLDKVLRSGNWWSLGYSPLDDALRPVPPLQPPVKPKGPDWSSVEVVRSPTRLRQMLGSRRDGTRG